MPELQPSTLATLDQFSGLVNEIADITTAHHARLTQAHLPPKLVATLTGDLHDTLLALFLPPPKANDDDG